MPTPAALPPGLRSLAPSPPPAAEAVEPEAVYARVLTYCQRDGVPDYLRTLSADWANGLWQVYDQCLRTSGVDLRGAVAVDFGCKFGHLLPLLLARGAAEAIGIDTEPEYVDAGSAMCAELFADARLVRTARCLLPFEPDSVDFVFINEVISHVNPAFLDTLWSELGRVLR